LESYLLEVRQGNRRPGLEKRKELIHRMLGRLEHRNIGCTHEESWTVGALLYEEEPVS